ncbi:MAG: CopG family transcriptional regulator [Cytophagaceae bacterium SCN 52-12]|nr:MAG: CopG family transcriptional regulator [Cytophagaceae bacterium SCN 52-12]
MTRQSVTLTKPNDEWLKARIESEEYTSKSEIVNDLIRRAREQERIEWIRTKLIKAEQSGFTDLTRDEILALSKAELRQNGKI